MTTPHRKRNPRREPLPTPPNPPLEQSLGDVVIDTGATEAFATASPDRRLEEPSDTAERQELLDGEG